MRYKSLFLSCLLIALTACGPANENFEQIGYYKSENRLRYFTFYVKGYEHINNQEIPSSLEKLISEHGSRQMNTAGEITASFYYTEKKQAPDVTNMKAQEANNTAHERKPIMSVWIMPSEQVNIFKNPE